MSERVVAIVQARMGSSRFPGKALEDLCGRPLIDWVLSRVRRAASLNDVVLAIPSAACDDGLSDFAARSGVRVFRGSELDVLGRFAGAAREYLADVVVRVCADNPLISPEEIDRLVDYFRTQRPDYAFNHVPRLDNRYPDGLGAEILSRALLGKIAARAHGASYREHVTNFIWDHADEFRIASVPCPPELETSRHIKLDIDTPEDLVRMRTLCRGLSPASTALEIVARWKELNP